jgi:hypothetical protein
MYTVRSFESRTTLAQAVLANEAGSSQGVINFDLVVDGGNELQYALASL